MLWKVTLRGHQLQFLQENCITTPRIFKIPVLALTLIRGGRREGRAKAHACGESGWMDVARRTDGGDLADGRTDDGRTQ